MTAARVGPAPLMAPFGFGPPGRAASLVCDSAQLPLRLACERDRTLGLGAVEQLDRRPRHHSADGMLVDELGVPVAPQQDREVVEPGDDALELDAVDQEDGHRGLVLAHMVQEHVLHILRFFSGHSGILLVVFAVVFVGCCCCSGHPAGVARPPGEGTLAAQGYPIASEPRRAANAWAEGKWRSGAARSTPPSCEASPISTAVTPAARAACISIAV